jgi:3-hydroxyisobutyrate dehydrogenase-like beta-hydroxyacid dehydrogenase
MRPVQREPATIGWLGLGDIGLPMVLHLTSDWTVRVCAHGRRAPVEQVVASGGIEVAGPFEVADGADVVVSVVRDQPQSEEALLSERGALAAMAPGSTLVLMSTLSPRFCASLAERAAERGVDMIDAPVSGGARGAAAGTLSIMVGGDDAVVARVRPLLERLGSDIFHLGAVGSGQVAKVVNNYVKICILAATTEGLDVGVRSGADLGALIEVLKASTASSQVLESWDSYYGYKLAHRPGGPLEILHKDLALFVELAGATGSPVPLADSARLIDVGRLVGETAPARTPATSEGGTA